MKNQSSLKLSLALALLLTANLFSPRAIGTPEDDYLKQGELLMQQEKYADSITYLDRVIKLNPNSLRAYIARGRDFNRLGLSRKAIEDCDKALALDPGNIYVLANRGNSYDSLGMYKEAIDDYNRAISINPKYSFAFSSRAYAFEKLGQFQDALDDYTTAFQIDPQSSLIISSRAAVYFNQGMYQKAIDDYTKAIAISPAKASYYAARAAAYRHIGQFDKSASDWAKAISCDPQIAVGKLDNYRDYADRVLDTENDVSFVNPDDSFAKEWTSENANLDSWSAEDKKFLSAVLSNIKKKSPGLIERACNGKKILLMLSKTTGKDRQTINTSAARIMLYPGALRLSVADLEWDLSHELTHYVDASQYISQDKKWLRLVEPLIERYNMAENYRQTVGHKVVPYAATLGVPTSYAASKPVEALAEFSAAQVLDDWTSSEGIASFLKKNILSEPKSSDSERDVLRDAVIAYGEAKYKDAVAAYSSAIKHDSKKAGLYIDRAAAFMRLDDYSAAVLDYNRAIKISAKNTDALCSRGIALEKLGEYDKAIDDYNEAIKIKPNLSQNLSINIADCKKALEKEKLKQ